MSVKEKYAPCQSWAPMLYTPPLSATSRGPEVTHFSENFMTASRGFAVGKALGLTAWQRWLVNSILETKEDGSLRYRQVVVSVPRKQGKTLLATAIVLNALAFWGSAQDTFSIGTNAEQARFIYEEAVKQIYRSPELQQIFYVTKDYIENRMTLARYKPLPANSSSAQGLASAMTVADEAHVYGNRAIEMYRAMHQSSGDRSESLMIVISTAGGSKASFLGDMYSYGEKVVSGEVEDSSFGIFWWGLADNDDIFDENNWYRANPNMSEGLISLEEMRQKFNEGLALPEGPRDFMRYRLNMWVAVSEQDRFIPDYLYESNTTSTDIALGARIALGFDGSRNDDSTGFVAIDLDTGVIRTLKAWHKPDKSTVLATGKPWMVPREEVNEAFEMIMANYKVLRFWADPSYFETDIQGWIKKHPKKNLIESQAQSRKNMVPMAAEFREDFLNGDIQPYAGDARLREHITNAIIWESGHVGKDKSRRDAKVDLCLAGIMANGARNDLIRNNELSPKKKIDVYSRLG